MKLRPLTDGQRVPIDPAQHLDLIATAGALGADGRVYASVQCWNGDVVHQDEVVLSLKAQRRAYSDEVADRTGVGWKVVDAALLKLLVGLPKKIPLGDDGGPDADDANDEGRQARSQASRLVQLAADAALFHSPDGEGFATITVGDHKESWPLKAKAFRLWLRRRYYEATAGEGTSGTAPNAQAVQDAVGVLEGRALFDGEQHAVWTRVAEHDGAIYLDLANEKWEAIEVTATGWRVVADPPVKFRRARGMAPLPYPVAGGAIAKLKDFLNVGSDGDFVLVVAWLVGSLRPRGPFAVLILYGEQGTAKSTMVRVLRALVDPSTVPLRSQPREERDLVIAATNSWCITLDNLSDLRDWLSDALCRLATGGGFGTRELFTDQDEVLFENQRPVVMDGIEEVATRPDLVDRGLALTLPPIPEEKRQAEDEFWPKFEAERPKLLGVLLDAVSRGLRDVGTVALPAKPRMADFAKWASAAVPAFGWTQEAFLRAYGVNRQDANDAALDAAAIFPALHAFLEPITEEWHGTATVLLGELVRLTAEREVDAVGDWADKEKERSEAVRKKAESIVTWRKDWPRNGRALSGALRRLAPGLRAAGIDVDFDRSGKKRAVVLKKLGNFASFASSASQPASDKGKPSDANPGCDANLAGSDANADFASQGEAVPDKGNDARDANDASRAPLCSCGAPAWCVDATDPARFYCADHAPEDGGQYRGIPDAAEVWS